MREIRIRRLWAQDRPVVNGWLHIPSGWSAELMAHAGWDSLTVDLQHGPVDLGQCIAMFQAISTTEVTPLARVPWNDPADIMRVLDAGAMGVICPMVNNREECERFVGACRYQPQGYRSMGPTRVSVYAGPDYVQHANQAVIAMAMVETREALERIEEIVSTPGLDAIYIGPSDLSMSLRGRPGVDFTDGEMLDAIRTICRAARAHGVVPGIHCGSPAYARRMIEEGFRFVTLLSDGRILARAAQALVAEMHAAGETSSAPSTDTSPY